MAICEELQLKHTSGLAKCQIGTVSCLCKSWDKALSILSESRDILRLYDDKENYAFVLMKLGNC